jgi:predicted phosphodiesterase
MLQRGDGVPHEFDAGGRGRKGNLKIQDTLVVVLSDMHSGGSTALFPNRFVQFKHVNHTPTPLQKGLFQHFDKCADYAREHRKDRRLIIVHDGDAIEGVHHNSIQVITQDKAEQAALHTELMDYFMRRAEFSRVKGDKLYYVSGTETHVDDKEWEIAKDLRAEQKDGRRVFDELELNINGRKFWFVHHGPKKGTGPTQGNALRLWLGRVYWDCLQSGTKAPDMIVTGHVHTPAWNTYVMDFHMIHGVIAPSWQAKTRFAYKVAPLDKNEIGAVFVKVNADGEIRTPVILRKDTDQALRISV